MHFSVTIFYYVVTVNYTEGVLFKVLQFVLITLYKERATGAFYVFPVIQ